MGGGHLCTNMDIFGQSWQRVSLDNNRIRAEVCFRLFFVFWKQSESMKAYLHSYSNNPSLDANTLPQLDRTDRSLLLGTLCTYSALFTWLHS